MSDIRLDDRLWCVLVLYMYTQFFIDKQESRGQLLQQSVENLHLPLPKMLASISTDQVLPGPVAQLAKPEQAGALQEVTESTKKKKS